MVVMLSGLDWRDGTLVAAGAIAIVTATIHGRLLDPMIIAPLQQADVSGMRRSAKALIRPLMHVSTIDWFLGGLALIATGLTVDGPGRIVVGALVGAQLSYAAACNACATRGRHPGWMLMAAAIVLIATGLSGWS
jgi:hypothetical protein